MMETADMGIPERRIQDLEAAELFSLLALLTERSVTQAARRLGRSQPTLSAALARHRRHFADDLLTRVGNHYELTRFAEQLLPLAHVAMLATERVFSAQPLFDPATSDRQFTIITSDYGLSVAGPPLLARMSRLAPNARIRFVPTSSAVLKRDPEYTRNVDGVFMPHGYLDLPRSLDLFQDRWVCIAARDNPSVPEVLSHSDLGILPWILTFHDPLGRAPAWRQMELLGIRPQVYATTDTFAAQPYLVRQTGCIAMIQMRLVDGLEEALGIRVLELPFEAVPIVEAFWWDPILDADPGHGWLREQLTKTADPPLGQGSLPACEAAASSTDGKARVP